MEVSGLGSERVIYVEMVIVGCHVKWKNEKSRLLM